MKAKLTKSWPADSVFATCDEASQFFAAGSLGYSATSEPATFQGLELCCKSWHAEALAVDEVHSSYFDDPALFPSGSIRLDNALLMREIEHEWIGQEDLCCGSAAVAAPANVPQPAEVPDEAPVPIPGLAPS